VVLLDKLVLPQIVHAQLDKLPLMKFVLLVVINVILVTEQLIHVLHVFLNQIE